MNLSYDEMRDSSRFSRIHVRSAALVLLLILGSTLASFLPGCLSKGASPLGSAPTSDDPGLASPRPLTKGVSFRFAFPDQAAASGSGIQHSVLPEVGTGGAIVTAQIHLLNIDSASRSTTVLSVSAPVDASGTANLTFSSIPAVSCIGEVLIKGGRIGSYSEFHGIADLVGDADNVIVIGPKETGTLEDVLAKTVRRIVADAGLFGRVTSVLAAKLESCAQGRDLTSPKIIDDIIAQFEGFDSEPRSFGIGTRSFVIQKSVPSGGGTIEVASGSALKGLQIIVPGGAFPSGTTVQVTVASVTQNSLGDSYQPLSPFFSIDNGGKMATIPVQIRIPGKVSEGKVPAVFRFDPTSGALECAPIVEVGSDSVTVATNNLSGYSPRASIRTAWNGFSTVFPGWVLVEAAIEALPNDVDSGFRPGTHSWKNPNYGSFFAFGGHCAGAVISAQYAFGQSVNPTIFGNYDRNQTPEIWEDDVDAIRLNSMVQNDLDWDSWSREVMKFMGKVSEGMTFNQFKIALHKTKQPQYISMRSSQGGHALLVTRIVGNTLYLFDPNYPTVERTLTFEGGHFKPFSASLKAGAAGLQFTEFAHVGVWSMIDSSRLARRWAEFRAGTVGEVRFSGCSLGMRQDDGIFRFFEESGFASAPSARFAVQLLGEFSSRHGLHIFRKGTGEFFLPDLRYVSPNAVTFQVALEPGENRLGFNILQTPDGWNPIWNGTDLTNGSWRDFQWMTIFAAPNSPTALEAIPGNGQVGLKWNPVSGAAYYCIYCNNSPEPATDGVKIGTSSVAAFAVKGLTNDTAYTFSVTAVATSSRGPLQSRPAPDVEATPIATDPVGTDLLDMVSIGPGSFQMGDATFTEQISVVPPIPVHKVILTRGFYMSRNEITQGLFQEIMGKNPSKYPRLNGNYPVENVSLLEVQEFCNKLSTKAGFTPCYAFNDPSIIDPPNPDGTWDPTANGYRLPTEAEWEYACRGGTVSGYFWGDHSDDSIDYVANHLGEPGYVHAIHAWPYAVCTNIWDSSNNPVQPSAVGTKLANPWGLFDIIGNVAELTFDGAAVTYTADEQIDPVNPGKSLEMKYLPAPKARGGDFSSTADDRARELASAARDKNFPNGTTSLSVGFRVVRWK